MRAGNGRISGLKKGIHSRVCVGSAISTTVSVLENVSFPCVQPQPVPRNRVKVGLLVVNSAGDGNLRHTPSFSPVRLIGRTFLTYQFPRACVGKSEGERNQIPLTEILLCVHEGTPANGIFRWLNAKFPRACMGNAFRQKWRKVYPSIPRVCAVALLLFFQ